VELRDEEQAELQVRLQKHLGREAKNAELQEDCDADDAEENARQEAEWAELLEKEGADRQAHFDAFELQLHQRAATSTMVGMVSVMTAAASAQAPVAVVVSMEVSLTPKNIIRYPEQVQQDEVVKMTDTAIAGTQEVADVANTVVQEAADASSASTPAAPAAMSSAGKTGSLEGIFGRILSPLKEDQATEKAQFWLALERWLAAVFSEQISGRGDGQRGYSCSLCSGDG